MKFLGTAKMTVALALVSLPVSLDAATTVKLAENVKTIGKATFAQHGNPLTKGLVVDFTTYYFPDAVVSDFHTSQGHYLVRVGTDANGAEAWKKGSGPLDPFVRETVNSGNWIQELLSVAPYVHDRMMKNRLDATLKGDTRSSTAEPDGSTRTQLSRKGTVVELVIKDGAFTKKMLEKKGVYRQQIASSDFDTILTHLPRKIIMQLGPGAGKPVTIGATTQIQTVQSTAPGETSEKIVDRIKEGMEPVNGR